MMRHKYNAQNLYFSIIQYKGSFTKQYCAAQSLKAFIHLYCFSFRPRSTLICQMATAEEFQVIAAIDEKISAS